MTPGRITQATAARLMYAAAQWANAEARYENSVQCGTDDEIREDGKRCDAAEAAFAELVATLTEPE
jgi:hypothetical protein